ncbi:MarR family winged helix-turn-helix transcriptional regulator [Aminipila terrae]|uniref:MarR family transcriptional regulator n=1 Tax=Aminipila terrae TaxID=2697030 RepID=A0A6P1MN55_9FIRM|nr:MarR family transcriptional regulator [Aminipila terrae]QHI73528.1 MarR family transcriptional regulator [Aminipila terrae]
MNNNKIIVEQIDCYYHSWFEINNIYHRWAVTHGIQDTTLFILYEIKKQSPGCTQSGICNKLFLPKQTVSKILSDLGKDNYIYKETNTKDRRNKLIHFTEKGEHYANTILEELKLAEIEAFKLMSQEQRINIVESFKSLCDSLSEKLY